MTRSPLAPLVVLCALALAGCSADTTTTPAHLAPTVPSQSVSQAPVQYVLDFGSSALSATLAQQVAAAGGTLTSALDPIGLAMVTSDDPSFRARALKINGVRAVAADPVVQWSTPRAASEPIELSAASLGDVTQQAAIGAGETFRSIEWSLDAISAPQAWATGQMGAGARVAVIDGGIHATHIDIAPALDLVHSKSFVDGKAFDTDAGTFWHGTHVAGIIAARANNVGTVGIAPKSTIIGVKALHNGSGSFTSIIRSIYYAATPTAEGGAGANIINMSIGAAFNRSEEGAAVLANALDKATSYADKRGVTVIAAAGNEATDFNHSSNLYFVPAMSSHVLSIAATSPVGFALGSKNFDVPTTYTNFGQSGISFAAPGGDTALPGSALCSYKRQPSGSSSQLCWVLDMVIAPCRGASNSAYCWASGTSMASPAAAGVAALIIGKRGAISPTQVEAALRASSDDLGKPGQDAYFGHGRVNALRAVQ